MQLLCCSVHVTEKDGVWQYDTEVDGEKVMSLPNPWLAAGASAVAFATGAMLPLLAGGFIRAWGGQLLVGLKAIS